MLLKSCSSDCKFCLSLHQTALLQGFPLVFVKQCRMHLEVCGCKVVTPVVLCWGWVGRVSPVLGQLQSCAICRKLFPKVFSKKHSHHKNGNTNITFVP